MSKAIVGDTCMSDEEIMKKKRQRFIVQSDTDDDDEKMILKNEEVKVETSTKSAKEQAVEEFIATGERLSKRIKSIDVIIASKNHKKEMNDKETDKHKHVNEKVTSMFYIFAICALVKLTLF
jgi:hypothetical protein